MKEIEKEIEDLREYLDIETSEKFNYDILEIVWNNLETEEIEMEADNTLGLIMKAIWNER